MTKSPLTAQPVFINGMLADIVVTQPNGISTPILGSGGKPRELALLSSLRSANFTPDTHLPVLLGSGVGFALEELVHDLQKKSGKNFHLAIVDKEEDILAASNLKKRYAKFPGIRWITAPDTSSALGELAVWQEECGNRPVFTLSHPFYSRLDKSYYEHIRKAFMEPTRYSFWEKVAYNKFTGDKARILFLTSKYFLTGEFTASCDRLGISYTLLQIPDGEMDQAEFVECFLSAVLSQKPDCVITSNHLGIDKEGVLTDLLERLKLPLATWFVDNPHLVLSHYANVTSPWLVFFTWDADNISSLKKMGCQNVHHLPLGVDHTRFRPLNPGEGLPKFHPYHADVCFVGNSMYEKVSSRLKKANLPPELVTNYTKVSAEFAESDLRSVEEFLRTDHPELLSYYNDIESDIQRVDYDVLLTWESTLQYRLSCVQSTLPFSPLIIGDPGWKVLLANSPHQWRYHPEVGYYSDLPLIYPATAINFNCTSKQMKGAVNQRVFDVPASGGFCLTDWREQIEDLFNVGTEMICYHSPGEAEDYIRYYLAHPHKRDKIAQAGRRRVLNDHTYDHRLRKLIATMKEIFG